MGRNAANDVVREEKNLSENEECVKMRKKLGSTALFTPPIDMKAMLTSVAKMGICSANPGGEGRNVRSI